MKLNILLLCNKPEVGRDANTILDHIEAIEHYSEHKIWLYSNLGDFSSKLDLDRFDVIIIHYSLCLLNNHYIARKSKAKLRRYQGLKVVFVQDEYRQINKMIETLHFLRIDVLWTCFPESDIERIYPDSKLPNMSKYNNLTGYIPKRLQLISDQPTMEKRALHVGYRGRKLPYWYGALAYEKWNIVEKWQAHTADYDLKTNISYHERDRIYGCDWNEFLSSCKTTLGVESGASVMDFTGDLERQIDFYQLTHPHDSFDTVQKKFLLPHEGQYKLNQISPRCFEAIALKTVLVLYEGEYSGILKPGRHYIPLKKDFSNIDSVVAHISDDQFLQAMADTAYEEIAMNPDYSYETFISKVDAVIRHEWEARSKSLVLNPYTEVPFTVAIRHVSFKSKVYQVALRLYLKLPMSARLVIKSILRPKIMLDKFTKAWFSLFRRAKQKKEHDAL